MVAPDTKLAGYPAAGYLAQPTYYDLIQQTGTELAQKNYSYCKGRK